MFLHRTGFSCYFYIYIYIYITNILPVICMKRQGSLTAVKKAMAQPSPLLRPGLISRSLVDDTWDTTFGMVRVDANGSLCVCCKPPAPDTLSCFGYPHSQRPSQERGDVSPTRQIKEDKATGQQIKERLTANHSGHIYSEKALEKLKSTDASWAEDKELLYSCRCSPSFV